MYKIKKSPHVLLNEYLSLMYEEVNVELQNSMRIQIN